MKKSVLFLISAASLAAQQLVIVSGNGQLILEQFPSPQQMIVRAVDASGRPVAGAPVSWAITRGQGTIRNPETVTDSEGLARAGFLATSIQPGSSYLQSVVTASSSAGSAGFYMTTTQSIGLGAAQPIIQVYGQPIIRGPAGSTVPEAVIVVVAASAGALLGQGIPNVGVRLVPSPNAEPNSPTAMCDGPGGVVLTDARGRATCNVVLGQNPGSASITIRVGEISSSREFGVEVARGQACSVSLNPSTLSFGSSGGTASFQVSAVNCAWTATTGANWVSFLSGTSGTGSGQVTVSVAPNSGASRSTLLSVGSATLNVTQSAAGTTLPLSFATQALPQATAGVAYSTVIAVSGGLAPYTWIASSALPAGLSLNSSSGALSGTLAAGTYPIAITVRDATGATINQTFTLNVSAGQSPGSGGIAITTTSLAPATLNTAYSQQIVGSGGCQNPFFGPARLEIVSGGLPPGLTARSAPGGAGLLVSGTPTQSGTYSFAVRASDSCGDFVTREFTLQVSSPTAPPMSSSLIALNFTIQSGSGRTPEQSLTLSAGVAAVPFTATATSDANWLGISPNSGVTSGTLTARVTNPNLQPGVYTGTITVVSDSPNSPLTIPATLTVTTGTSLAAAPSALTFEFEPGGLVPAPQTITVSSAGAIVPFSTSAATVSGGSWLVVSQSSLSSPAFVSVAVNPSGLAPGTYSGSVTVAPAFNLPPVNIPVTLNVAVRAAGPTVTSTAHGASFASGPVAPGQILTVFGREMGPVTLTTFRLTPAGTIDTQLADVRVLFDEIPAPLLHVSASQITVVVPYGIAGRTSTRMQVEYRGVRSASLDLPVAESAPGLFTVGGSTQGAILNQDNTANGPQNGAQPGTVVSLYATGEGITVPASIEGAIVSPTALARPLLPVSVTIGGHQAEVLYAGSAPGLPAGVLQVNARVPPEVPVGTALPVIVTVGSASSQPNVTLFVRP